MSRYEPGKDEDAESDIAGSRKVEVIEHLSSLTYFISILEVTNPIS